MPNIYGKFMLIHRDLLLQYCYNYEHQSDVYSYVIVNIDYIYYLHLNPNLV